MKAQEKLSRLDGLENILTDLTEQHGPTKKETIAAELTQEDEVTFILERFDGDLVQDGSKIRIEYLIEVNHPAMVLIPLFEKHGFVRSNASWQTIFRLANFE